MTVGVTQRQGSVTMTAMQGGGDYAGRRVGFVRRLAIAGVVVTLAATAVTGAPAGASSVLTEESFRGSSASTGVWVAGGAGGVTEGWPDGACLTAGANTSASPLPGCGLATPDPAGQGALRLTPADFGRAGFALRNGALPSSYGLDITFTMAQWGGNGADGIAFFLANGDADLSAPGAAGGSLGYAPFVDSGLPGVNGGLLGIGFDSYGNYGEPGSNGRGCSFLPGEGGQRVSLRGAGQGLDGYCLLAVSGSLARPLTGSTRSEAARVVRVVIDPDSEDGQLVRVYLDGVEILVAPVPREFTQASTFKFGFTASTGGLTNNHEIWGMDVASVEPVPDFPEPDVDGDGIPESLDSDIDDDGVPNAEDTDVDGDGIPNDEDADIDGDGIPNEQDADSDGDGVPNVEDTDADGPSAAPVVLARPSFTG